MNEASALYLAGCVLVDESKRILLIHRNKNGLVQWELPGGKIDAGESAGETAMREIEEELGVAVEIVRELGSATFEGPDGDCYYTWFLAKIVEGEPQLCEPQTFDTLRYYTIDDMHELKLSDNMKNLAKAFDSGTVNIFT